MEIHIAIDTSLLVHLVQPIGIFAPQKPAEHTPYYQLNTLLKVLSIPFTERYGTYELPISISAYKTIYFEFTGGLEMKDLVLKGVQTIIVQNSHDFEVWKDRAKAANIQLLGFKQGHACFLNNGLCSGDAVENPFFLPEDTKIPDDNLYWSGWTNIEDEF